MTFINTPIIIIMHSWWPAIFKYYESQTDINRYQLEVGVERVTIRVRMFLVLLTICSKSVPFKSVMATSSSKQNFLDQVSQRLPIATGPIVVAIGEYHSQRPSGSIGLQDHMSRSTANTGQVTSTSTDHSLRSTSIGHSLSVSTDKKHLATSGGGVKNKLMAGVRTKQSVSDKKDIS